MWKLDRDVEDFLRALDLDRTALVLTSDHGEAFGEGGRWEHNDILECQVRVPLLVRPAGGVEGRRSELPVSGVDVAPTLLALAGLEPLSREGQGPRFDGLDLLQAEAERPLLVEDRDHLDPLDVRIALYSGHWKLLRLGVGEEMTWELFDLEQDPEGLVDVAEDHPDVLEELQGLLEDLRAGWGADDARDLLEGGDGNLDALQGLGYTN
jgi:arylsulfatase A-like enzyme